MNYFLRSFITLFFASSALAEKPQPLKKTIYPGIQINPTEQFVDVTSSVCLAQGALEFIACTKDTKEHESLVMVHAKPMHIHIALVLLGAKPGHPAIRRMIGEEENQRFIDLPPKGAPIAVSLVFKGDDGKQKEFPISHFVSYINHESGEVSPDNNEAKKQLETFLFAGSHLFGKGEGPKTYLADNSGHVISLSTFGDEVLCLPEVYAHQNHALQWEINSKDLPKIGTEIILRLRPQTKKKAIPLDLPDPDGKQGASNKPVKVYLLAGQSNMVGMGDLSGAQNIYNGVFLTSDPEVTEEVLYIHKVGNFKIDHLTTYAPSNAVTTNPLKAGTFSVPISGTYRVHGDSRLRIIGKKIDAPIDLKAGTRYLFDFSDFANAQPRFWLEKTDLVGNGDLESIVKREKKFPYLIDKSGNWTVRNDVYFHEARVAVEGKGSPLSATSNGKAIGPELGFGHVLGTFHDEQVLLIKTAMGNRALGFDFRPPSSGRTDPNNKWESLEYRLMIEGVQKTLANIADVVPGYQGQGYELAGFVWWQGHKDSSPELAAEYEKNLVNLINDVRKDLKTPNLPAVVATVGFGGHRISEKYIPILNAQLAIGDPKKHPEFAGTVASVDTRDFWREVDESPRNQDYHYNRNAETYLLVGDALGRAMVGLLGGKAEPTPRPNRPIPKDSANIADLTPAQITARQKARRAIVLEAIIPSYLANPRYQKALVSEAAGERPSRPSQFLEGALFGLTNIYAAAGISDYEWKPFGTDLRSIDWQYTSFDPKELLAKDYNGPRYRKVTYPEGMANWASPTFDATNAGWKTGKQPFGQLDGKLAPLRSCSSSICGCGHAPLSLWEKEVLLARTTVELPPFEEGHRYRIIVGGSAHVNAGEGFALYLNGKLLAESKVGVGKRQGGQPRGSHIFTDIRETFKGGKVTIAATSFLRFTSPRGPAPPNGHLSIWIEEQKIPFVTLN